MSEISFQDAIKRILRHIGEDPERDGLKETPERVERSYTELFSGYRKDIGEVFKTFESEGYDELIVVRCLDFVSTCEHHLMQFMGVAHIGYVPDKRILGLSKFARLLDIFSKRLQVQERLTVQITDAIETYLHPQGCACVIEAQHLCLVCRGAKKQNSVMVTSSLTGCFREGELRTEFLNLIKG